MQEIQGQFSPNDKQQQNAQLTGRNKKKKIYISKEQMENIIIITSEVGNFNMLSVRHTLKM